MPINLVQSEAKAAAVEEQKKSILRIYGKTGAGIALIVAAKVVPYFLPIVAPLAPWIEGVGLTLAPIGLYDKIRKLAKLLA